jgi:hypothetical protein
LPVREKYLTAAFMRLSNQFSCVPVAVPTRYAAGP